MPPTPFVPEAPGSPRPDVPAAAVPGRPQPSRPRTRRRFWFLLALTLLLCFGLSTPVWQFLLRRTLQWEVKRHGGELTIGRVEGGPFDTFQLHDVRCRQSMASPASDTGTDVRLARIDLTLSWPGIFRLRSGHSWVQQIILDGVSGRYDFAGGSGTTPSTAPVLPRGSWLSRHASRFIPASFFLRAGDFTVQRGHYHLRARDLRLSGDWGNSGFLLAREV